MASSGSIWVSLGLRTANFQKGLKGAKGQLSGFQKGMAGLKGMFNPFTIGAGAVAGLGAALTNAMGIVNDFEKAGSDLKAVLGDKGTAGAMMLMNDQAKELGASTAFTATEVSSLQKEFAKLGFDPSQIQGMTEATLNLAAAAGVELSEAASVAGATINAFGLSASDSQSVTDVMALSFSRSALDMEKFSETMKNAAPIAKATGVSLEEATAAAGKLADANISGSKAGTDLKKIFSELVKDGKPFQESLADIAKQMAGAETKAEKLAIAEGLVGDRAKGALLILAEQKEGLGELAKEFENVDGEAKEMADTMLDNVQGSMTKAGSAYEGMVLSIEDGSGVISKSIQGVIDSFAGMLQSITAFNNTDLSIFQRFAETSGVAGVKMGEFTQKLVGAVSASKSMVSLQANTTKAIAALKIQFQQGTISAEGYKNGLVEIRAAAEATKGALSPLKTTVDEQVTSTENAVTSSNKLTDAQKKQKLEIAALKAEYGNLSKVLPKTAQGLKVTATSTDEITAKIKRLTSSLGTMEIGTEAYTKLDEQIELLKLSLEGKQLKIGIYPSVQAISEEEMATYNAQQEQLKANADLVGTAVADSFGAMAQGMVANMGFADDAMGRFQQSMASTVISLITQYLAQAMAAAIAGASTSASATGPGAVVAGPTFIATAIASILGAFASIPAFAEGGLVFNDMIGLIGEGKGTTRSNPEVIAPLDKLKNFMGDQGGSGMGGEVVFRIQGDELVGMLNRKNKVNKFSR